MENRKRSILYILGFLLFLFGMLSLILSIVNVRLTLLSPIDDLGYLTAAIVKLVMVISGLSIVYMLQTNR